METSEAINWLKNNNLYESAKHISPILKKVFSSSLGIRDEKILIIGDIGFANRNISSLLSGAYYLAAEELKFDTKFVLQKPKHTDSLAEEDVISSMEDLQEQSAVILNLSNKLGNLGDLGKSFRKLCKKKNYRFISSLGLGDLTNDKLGLILPAIDVSYKTLQLRYEKLKALLDNGNEINVKTKLGTDLYFNIKGMKAVSADGNYNVPGKGGNLPAGEVYIPPNGKRVEGKVVIDGSSRNHVGTVLIKTPITITIEEGSATSIEGGKEAKILEKALKLAADKAKYPALVNRVCEFGIGINPNAKIIGATIIDEKALGTAHIAIGSNYWFGGDIYTIVHLDQIFKEPVIRVDGKVLEL